MSYERNNAKYMFPHEFKTYAGRKPVSAMAKGWGLDLDRGDRSQQDDRFRQRYRSAFTDKTLHKDSDVSHIIASNKGGINATENVFMFDKRLNRAIGDSQLGMALNSALVGKKRACDAARLSRKHGSYEGKTGSQNYSQGVRVLKTKGVMVRKGGGIDRRSAAVRSGDLVLNKDGSIRSNAAFKIWS
eukprot:jgi/Bigna1/79443/fgenesh1_pg.62_\